MDPDTEERLDDPLNPDRYLWNGLGAYNHYFYMPKGGPTPLALVEPGVPRGRVTRHKVETDSMAVGDERTGRPVPTSDPEARSIGGRLRRARLPAARKDHHHCG